MTGRTRLQVLAIIMAAIIAFLFYWRACQDPIGWASYRGPQGVASTSASYISEAPRPSCATE